jgi:hypothetical protein
MTSGQENHATAILSTEFFNMLGQERTSQSRRRSECSCSPLLEDPDRQDRYQLPSTNRLRLEWRG